MTVNIWNLETSIRLFVKSLNINCWMLKNAKILNLKKRNRFNLSKKRGINSIPLIKFFFNDIFKVNPHEIFPVCDFDLLMFLLFFFTAIYFM
jgi:hypothetical protein